MSCSRAWTCITSHLWRVARGQEYAEAIQYAIKGKGRSVGTKETPPTGRTTHRQEDPEAHKYAIKGKEGSERMV